MRHPDETKEVAQPIGYLWPRHHEIIRRVVAGERPTDIAKAMGLTDSRLSIILRSPLTKERVQYLTDQADGVTMDIKRRLQWLSQQSMDILEEALTKPTEAAGGLTLLQKVRVAQDQLDRDGHGKIALVHSKSIHVHCTTDDIAQMKSRINGGGPVNGGGSSQRRLFGREAGMSPAGRTVDVEESDTKRPTGSNEFRGG